MASDCSQPSTNPTLLRRAVLEDDDPVLFIENKAMYARPVREAPADGRLGDFHARTTRGIYPTVTLSFDSFSRADVTLVAYGGWQNWRKWLPNSY